MTEFAVYWRIALYCLLIAAAVSDVRRFEIPNKYPIAALALFGVAFVATALTQDIAIWQDASMRALGFIVSFAIGFLLFIFKIMGGGDAKLFMVLGLWFGLPELAGLALYIGLAGALVGLTAAAIYLVKDLVSSENAQPLETETVSKGATQMHPFRRALRRRVPYGVAICLGAIASGEWGIAVLS